MNSNEFDKEFDLEHTINFVMENNAELLERLGSDYDENGIAYWEKLEPDETQSLDI